MRNKIAIIMLLVLDLAGICQAKMMRSNTDPTAVHNAVFANPRLTRIGKIRHLETFDTPAYWTGIDETIVSADTTNYMATDGTYLQGTKVTCVDGYGAIYHDFDPPLDLSNCHLVLNFYIWEGTDANSSYTKMDDIRLQIFDANGGTTYLIAVYTTSNEYVPGWRETNITMSWKYAGTVDLEYVTRIKLLLNTVSPSTASITFGRLMFYEKPTTPGVVIFCFDGCYATQERAAAYLNSKGIPGTFFSSSADVGTGNRMTLATLHKLKKAGNLIANYPTYGYYWENLTLAQKIDVVKRNGDYLWQQGFGDGARLMSTPGTGYNQDDENLIIGGYIDFYTGHYNWSSTFLSPNSFYNLRHQPVTVSTSSADHNSVLDYTIADHGIAILTFHQVDGQSSDVTYNYFKSVVDYAKTKIDAGNLLALTPADLLAGNWGETPLEQLDCYVTSQFDKVNDVNLEDIPGLSATLTAGKTYSFEVTLFVTAATTGLAKIAMSGGTDDLTATTIIYDMKKPSTGQTTQTGIVTRATALDTSTTSSHTGSIEWDIVGTITVNAGGALRVQFAQNAVSANTSSVLIGSFMKIKAW